MLVERMVELVRFFNEGDVARIFKNNFVVGATSHCVSVKDSSGLVDHGLGGIDFCAGPTGQKALHTQEAWIRQGGVGYGQIAIAPDP